MPSPRRRTATCKVQLPSTEHVCEGWDDYVVARVCCNHAVLARWVRHTSEARATGQDQAKQHRGLASLGKLLRQASKYISVCLESTRAVHPRVGRNPSYPSVAAVLIR